MGKTSFGLPAGRLAVTSGGVRQPTSAPGSGPVQQPVRASAIGISAAAEAFEASNDGIMLSGSDERGLQLQAPN